MNQSQSVRSAERAAHHIGLSGQIERLGKCSSKKARSSKNQWGGAPSTWTIVFAMFCNRGRLKKVTTCPGIYRQLLQYFVIWGKKGLQGWWSWFYTEHFISADPAHFRLLHEDFVCTITLQFIMSIIQMQYMKSC